MAILPLIAAAASIPAAEPLDLRWDPGAEVCAPGNARTEVRAYEVATLIIRQNPCVDFEANLVYLLLGEERALLIDSGASEDPAHTAELVKIVEHNRKRADGTSLPLTVVHTHRHSDHRAGDAAFARLTDATVAPIESDAVRKFFGLGTWPEGSGAIELGGRRIEVLPAPGHHEDHVVFFDPRTKVLFTGDFLLPGRLLVDDIDAYRASARRVAEFAASHGVVRALGAHIELDNRGELYPHGATLHANERDISLAPDDVRGLPAALESFNGFYSSHANYVIENPIRNLIVLAIGV
jgi:glyoxylase-like metal-dependent hydrolase (beta-lactamase superfamily II)